MFSLEDVATSRGPAGSSTPILPLPMNKSLLLAVFLCWGMAAAEAQPAREHDTRPNILLILCDDLGYADVGFNAELFDVETDVVTPHLDEIAKAGMVFKQAYVAHPFCGPSRMGLMTGRIPHCFGGQKTSPMWQKTLRTTTKKAFLKARS